MNIYFSGIGGVGIGPLAEIALGAGYKVFGSDLHESPICDNLKKAGVEIQIGAQNGEFLKQKFIENGIDWFVHTSALPENHPELQMARELGIKISKRDELLNEIIQTKNLKLIAIAGTHGKTTTTGMAIWAFQQLGIPVSWSIGATLNFGKSGFFDSKSQFFIYEADEFDRNFLHFSPFVNLTTSIDYDHTDVYKSQQDYFDAFKDFAKQSDFTISWSDQNSQIFNEIKNKAILKNPAPEITLFGEHNRRNATLVLEALDFISANGFELGKNFHEKAIVALNNFPGADRRFEKITDGIFSDYGHHPIEIQATLELAREFAEKNGFSGIGLVYQPHQNVRQHEIQDEYAPEIFQNADEIIWLPTYLSRENPELEILSPEFLSRKIAQKTAFYEMNDDLVGKIRQMRAENLLILAMSAGSLDKFIRDNFQN